jgi:hypothetical protein
MARFNYSQTQFNSGEFSPRLRHRTTFERYRSAVKSLTNFWITPHGGLYKRPGTVFVAPIKNESERVRLLPFVFNTTQAYVIEAGDLYFRFYTLSGRLEDPPGTPVEVVTPYTAAETYALQFAQSADVMYFVHPDHPIHELRRTSATAFTFEPTVLDGGPYLTPNADETKFLALSARTDNVTITATGHTPFLAGHVGSTVRVNLGGQWGNARVTTFNSTTSVDATVEEPMAELVNFSGVATYRELRLLTATATDILSQGYRNESDMEYRSVELYLGSQGAGLDAKKIWVELRDTTSATPGLPANAHLAKSRVRVGADITAVGGWVRFTFDDIVTIRAGTNHHVVLRSDSDQSDTVNFLWFGVTTSVYTDGLAQEFDGTNWGTSGSIGTFALRRNSTDLWALPAFSDATGWPRAICFYDQRLFLGGAQGAPQSYYGSKIGDHLTFTPGVEDADAISYRLGETELNTIEWLAGLEDLFIGTAGGEFKIESGTTATLTPTNPGIVKNISAYGAAPVAPIRAGKHLLFLQRGQKVIRELSYTEAENSFDGVDISILAEHLFTSGIVQFAYQTEPDPLIVCVTASGVLLTGAYHRQQDVIGWSKSLTDGTFESVITIPHPTAAGSQIWIQTARSINGTTRRYVEYFGRVEGSIYPSIYVDAGLKRTGAPTSTLTGLSHLEGKEVSILGDGAVYPPFTVSGGAVVSISPTVSIAEVGLPFTAQMEMLRPFSTDKNILNFRMSDVYLAINIIDSLGMTVNGDPVPFGVGTPAMDAPPDLVTEGTIEVSTLQWGLDVPLIIEQPNPLPLHVVAVSRVIQTQEL